jgi:hypothetical protein
LEHYYCTTTIFLFSPTTARHLAFGSISLGQHRPQLNPGL